jgi:hypothetical protein
MMTTLVSYRVGSPLAVPPEVSGTDIYWGIKKSGISDADLLSMLDTKSFTDIVITFGEIPKSWKRVWKKEFSLGVVESYLHGLYYGYITDTVLGELTEVNAPYRFTALSEAVQNSLRYIKVSGQPLKSSVHALPALAFLGGATGEQISKWVRLGIMPQAVEMMMNGVEPEIVGLAIQYDIDPEMARSLRSGDARFMDGVEW